VYGAKLTDVATRRHARAGGSTILATITLRHGASKADVDAAVKAVAARGASGQIYAGCGFFFMISLARPHVLRSRMGAQRTSRGADAIELTATHGLLCGFSQARLASPTGDSAVTFEGLYFSVSGVAGSVVTPPPTPPPPTTTAAETASESDSLSV